MGELTRPKFMIWAAQTKTGRDYRFWTPNR